MKTLMLLLLMTFPTISQAQNSASLVPIYSLLLPDEPDVPVEIKPWAALAEVAVDLPNTVVVLDASGSNGGDGNITEYFFRSDNEYIDVIFQLLDSPYPLAMRLKSTPPGVFAWVEVEIKNDKNQTSSKRIELKVDNPTDYSGITFADLPEEGETALDGSIFDIDGIQSISITGSQGYSAFISGNGEDSVSVSNNAVAKSSEELTFVVIDINGARSTYNITKP